jgi:hypothetical protein
MEPLMGFYGNSFNLYYIVGGSCGDWMELAQDRDGRRALVGTVMELSGTENAGNFLTSYRTR